MNPQILMFFAHFTTLQHVLPLGEPHLLRLQLLLQLPAETTGKLLSAGSRAEVWAEQGSYMF